MAKAKQIDKKRKIIEAAIAVIDQLDGATRVAELITKETKVPMQRETVQKWKNNGVPLKSAPLVARLAGLEVKQVRPDFML